MLIVDSTVWINYFNGIESPQTDYLNSILETTTNSSTTTVISMLMKNILG